MRPPLRTSLERAWYVALVVAVSPLFIDVFGLAPFVPAYVTLFAWIAIAVSGLRPPEIGDRTYAVALFVLAVIGAVGTVALIARRDGSWLMLSSGVVVTALCLASLRPSSSPIRAR